MNTAPFATTSAAAAPLSLELLEARRSRDDLRTLLRAERAAAADFLLALAGFDRRRGWEPLGHASLFAFLRAELGLSKSAAFWRLSAARLLLRFPDVIEPLREGLLCMSTTAELAKVLTTENQASVLPRYFGLSAREAMEVTAGLQPHPAPPEREVVTRLATERSAIRLQAGAPMAPDVSRPVLTMSAVLTSEPNAPVRVPERRDDIEPLTADLRRLHVTVSAGLLKMIDEARDGLSHALPDATTEQVLEAALKLLLEKQAKARGLVKKPKTRMAARRAFGAKCVDRYGAGH